MGRREPLTRVGVGRGRGVEFQMSERGRGELETESWILHVCVCGIQCVRVCVCGLQWIHSTVQRVARQALHCVYYHRTFEHTEDA